MSILALRCLLETMLKHPYSSGELEFPQNFDSLENNHHEYNLQINQ